MILFSDTNMAETLRKKCDKATKRIWIVSPFVGGASDIDCILGANWKNKDIDRRLILDAVSGSMPKATITSFFNSGIQMKSLHGVHAKIYLVDDWCMLTSANLTGSAFSKRLEIGTVVESTEDIAEIVETFNTWWEMSTNVNPESIVNEIVTNNNFKKLIDLPALSPDATIEKKEFERKKLNVGEYRIDGVLLKQGLGYWSRPCLLLRCVTDNDPFSGYSFVAIYDSKIIALYNIYLQKLGKNSLGYEECEKMPANLRYISHMKSKQYTLGVPYVRFYLENVSPGTYTASSYVDNYDGWEYDCASPYPIPTGEWRIDKQLEAAWLRNPFPEDAYPVQHFNIEVHIWCESPDVKVEDIEFEKIRDYMIADFYRKYNPGLFPPKKNRKH